jgi:hypothetical protein
MLKEAEALLVVTDTRTGIQVAVVQGSAKARDLGSNLELDSLTVFAALAGYSNTRDHERGFFRTGSLNPFLFLGNNRARKRDEAKPFSEKGHLSSLHQCRKRQSITQLLG